MKPQKLACIDAMRGLAAIYIALYHFSLLTIPMAIAPRWLEPLTGLGGMAVTLFFVISAFTLCLSMDSRQDEATPIMNYFLRRFFRIAPLFYIWIIISCIRDLVVFNTVHSIGELARSFFFVLNFFPGHEQGFVWASWTLGVEMLFYIFFPLIFWKINNVGKAACAFLISLLIKMLWYTVVIAIVPDQHIAQEYYSFSLLNHLPTFLMGMLCYHIYRLINIEAASRYGVGYLLIGVFLAELFGLAYGKIDVSSFPSLIVEAFLFGTLLIGLSITPLPLFVNRLTRFCGEISYSVYLSHATIFFFMSKVFALIYKSLPYVTVAYTVSVVLGFAIVIPLSYITYRYIEMPGNKLGRAIIRARAPKIALSMAEFS